MAAAALSLLAATSPPPPPVEPPGQETSDLLKALGVGSAILAQVCGSIGLLCMKSSSIYEYGLPWHKKCRLFAGILFQGLIPVFTDSFAYAVCPLSLLAPLSGVTIAATILLTAARCCGVREPVHCADFAVVVLVISGVTLVNVYGPHNSSKADMEQLKSYMLDTAFLVYSSCLAGLVCLWLAIYVLVDLEFLNWLRPHPNSTIMCLMCALTAASCSSLTQIFLKIVSMVVRQFAESHEFAYDQEFAPLIIASCLLVLSAACQIYLINATMASGKIIVAVPSYSSLTIILTIVGSSIFYGDFKTIEPSHLVNFSVGVAIVSIGIILLSVLQACRYQRKKRTKERRPMEGDRLLSKSPLPDYPASLSRSASGTTLTIDESAYEPSENDVASVYSSEAVSTASGPRLGR